MEVGVLDLATLIAITGAIVEIGKRAAGERFDSVRFGPLAALAVGIIVAVLASEDVLGWVDLNAKDAALPGLISGLTASGVYRAVTTNPTRSNVPGLEGDGPA